MNEAHVDIADLQKKVSDFRALLSADKARKNLMPFIEETFPNYKPAAHHRLIADKLEAVERGEIKRLMIFCPPQHGKSQIASIHFPAWYIGRNPDKRIITASYSGRLADDFGRQARNLVQDEEYRHVFPDIALSADSQAANRWHIDNHRGYYMSVGVQGATTGRGADLFLIDDPVRDASEADSEVMRDRIWDWFATVAYTRLGPNCGLRDTPKKCWERHDGFSLHRQATDTGRQCISSLPHLKRVTSSSQSGYKGMTSVPIPVN